MVSEIYNLIMRLGKYFGDTHIYAAINLKFVKRSSAIFILWFKMIKNVYMIQKWW